MCVYLRCSESFCRVQNERPCGTETRHEESYWYKRQVYPPNSTTPRHLNWGLRGSNCAALVTIPLVRRCSQDGKSDATSVVTVHHPPEVEFLCRGWLQLQRVRVCCGSRILGPRLLEPLPTGGSAAPPQKWRDEVPDARGIKAGKGKRFKRQETFPGEMFQI